MRPVRVAGRTPGSAVVVVGSPLAVSVATFSRGSSVATTSGAFPCRLLGWAGNAFGQACALGVLYGAGGDGRYVGRAATPGCRPFRVLRHPCPVDTSAAQ